MGELIVALFTGLLQLVVFIVLVLVGIGVVWELLRGGTPFALKSLREFARSLVGLFTWRDPNKEARLTAGHLDDDLLDTDDWSDKDLFDEDDWPFEDEPR